MSRAQKVLRSSTEFRRLAEAIVIVLALQSGDAAYAQMKVVRSSFGSGTSLSTDKNTTITSVFGEPFIGTQSAGNIVLTSGFASFVLGKGRISGASNSLSGIPKTYTLSQNYPNPFNPTTTIRFGLPTQSHLKLQVFNVLGQLVKEIVNYDLGAGYYEKQWTAGVASGMYIYRIEAVSIENPNKRFVDVKKMILLK